MPSPSQPCIEPGTTATAPRRSIFFLAGSLAGGNLLSTGIRMIGGVLLGRLVPPATLGLFNGIGLVLGYAPFLQLGILNGLNRELPYHMGKGDRERVNDLASAALAWALVVGIGACATLLGVAAWYAGRGDLWKAAGWSTNAILAVVLFYNTYYLQMTYRTSHDFARLALVNVVESTVGLAMLVGVAFLNYYGLCLRALAVGVVSTAILHYWRPVRAKPKWNANQLKHLLAIGAPIFGVGQLYGWWLVLNSTLVLKLSGTYGMGLFSMAVVTLSAIEFIPVAVSQVVYPRLAEEYGRNGSVPELVRVARTPIAVTAVGMIPVVAAAWLVVGPAVRWVIPDYSDAVPAMQWILPLAFISSFQPLNAIFNVIRRQDLYVMAILLGMVVNGAVLLWLTRDSVSLAAFPQAMIAGRGVFMVTCYALVGRLLRRNAAS